MPIQINKAFREVKDCIRRFVVLYGGAGSGKSYYISQHIILDCLNNRNIKWCCIRKVARTIRESVFAEITARIQEYGFNDYFQINKSDYTITCIPTGSKIIMTGIDDPEKIKSISSVTKFWIEEASELSLTDFKQVNLRLRGKSEIDKQIFISFNPVHNRHWLKEYFFDNPKHNSVIIKTTYHDNAFLDDEYKAELEALKDIDEYFYSVYCLGQWGNLTGVIYSNWSVTNVFPGNCDEIIYGLDFGFNNPTALVKVGIKDRLYYIDELLYRSNMTNSDLIQQLKTLNITGTIYADAAEPARILEIQNVGFNVVAADKSVIPGIDYCKAQQLRVTESSINLINELNTYSWKKDKSNKSLDEPIKINDHLTDAFRYAIYSHNKNHVSLPHITANGIIRTPSQPIDHTLTRSERMKLRNRFRI